MVRFIILCIPAIFIITGFGSYKERTKVGMEKRDFSRVLASPKNHLKSVYFDRNKRVEVIEVKRGKRLNKEDIEYALFEDVAERGLEGDGRLAKSFLSLSKSISAADAYPDSPSNTSSSYKSRQMQSSKSEGEKNGGTKVGMGKREFSNVLASSNHHLKSVFFDRKKRVEVLEVKRGTEPKKEAINYALFEDVAERGLEGDGRLAKSFSSWSKSIFAADAYPDASSEKSSGYASRQKKSSKSEGEKLGEALLTGALLFGAAKLLEEDKKSRRYDFKGTENMSVDELGKELLRQKKEKGIRGKGKAVDIYRSTYKYEGAPPLERTSQRSIYPKNNLTRNSPVQTPSYISTAMRSAKIKGCKCSCVNGESVPLCPSSLSIPEPCTAVCPIYTKRYQLPSIEVPPVGTSACKNMDVYDEGEKRYKVETICY